MKKHRYELKYTIKHLGIDVTVSNYINTYNDNIEEVKNRAFREFGREGFVSINCIK